MVGVSDFPFMRTGILGSLVIHTTNQRAGPDCRVLILVNPVRMSDRPAVQSLRLLNPSSTHQVRLDPYCHQGVVLLTRMRSESMFLPAMLLLKLLFQRKDSRFSWENRFWMLLFNNSWECDVQVTLLIQQLSFPLSTKFIPKDNIMANHVPNLSMAAASRFTYSCPSCLFSSQ